MDLIEVDKLKEFPFIKTVFDDLTKSERDALKADIQEKGIRMPIEILPNYTIIDGHHRVSIAKELGITQVPYIQKDLLENDAKIWSITSNLFRRQLQAWQRAVPVAVLSKLYELGRGGDRRSEKFKDANSASLKSVSRQVSEVLGVSSRLVDTYRAYARAVEKYPDLKGQPIVTALAAARRTEDIAERKDAISGITIQNLLLGDALTRIDEVPDDSIDALITDPPYGIDYDPHTSAFHGAVHGDDETIFGVFGELMAKVDTKLKKDAFIYVFTSWKTICDFMPLIKKYWQVQTVIVWSKGNWTAGDLFNNYGESYELIIYASKGNKMMNYETRPCNLISCTRPNNDYRRRMHPSEKPIELMKTLIGHSTVEGEVVIDPFCGSGSTLLAAEQMKRNWIGIEIDPQWYENARIRICEMREQKI